MVSPDPWVLLSHDKLDVYYTLARQTSLWHILALKRRDLVRQKIIDCKIVRSFLVASSKWGMLVRISTPLIVCDFLQRNFRSLVVHYPKART